MKAHFSHPSVTSKVGADYKRRIAAVYTGAVILAAAETNGIGAVRMAELLTNYGEWLDDFSENAADGVGYDILVKRLTERGLYELFEALVPSEKEFRRTNK